MCLLFNAHASDLPKRDWNWGKILLKEGNVLEGEIQHDLDQNVVLLKKEGVVKAFSVYNVNYFKVIDEDRGMIRNFYSMPYEQNGHERLMFFELVFEDGFVLFSRESKVAKKHAQLKKVPYVQDGTYDSSLVKVSNYYLFMPDGTFQAIHTDFSSIVDSLSLNKEEKKEMRQFILQNDLDLNDRSDFIKVLYEMV
ncbi:hypothetical protein [Catalinimonas alkaloidigena]|uniref:hypothetical protein n=1 Tax=Catalinimonas alkaloidigena TaxID=1075417 RepID=UPI002406EF24|nr:hypothetical protein [Catalinimonas alkaloidigena]